MQHAGGNYQTHLFMLMGPSCVGKSTILRYIKERIGADSAPKYTTRPSRGTEEDAQDFIFCDRENFPGAGILRFESYGEWFGIQLDQIANSFKNGRSHITIVGDCSVASGLSSIYNVALVAIFVFCDSCVLKSRVFSDPSPHRAERWPQIREEMARMYDQLGCVEFVINNSGSMENTFLQVNRLLAMLERGRVR